MCQKLLVFIFNDGLISNVNLISLQSKKLAMKQINVKQAQKWLQKLKNENLQSYKDISKFLRKYQKTQDEHDCYIKISHILLSHTELTKQINVYMQQGNKFVINKPEDEKIKEFMGYVKKNRPDVFEKIIQMIQQLSKSKCQNSLDISKSLKPRLRQIIQGDQELERITEEALDLTGEQLINRKNLEYLKSGKILSIVGEDQKELLKPKQQQKSQGEGFGKKVEQKLFDYKRQGGKQRRQIPLTIFTNSSQEKPIFKHLEKCLEQAIYSHLMKIIRIYYLNIITRNETFELLSLIPIDEFYMECLKDIIDARETERRKISVFRPLNDMNFSNYQRASPSYVTLPIYYPIKCSGRSIQLKKIMNQKWVSVPHGSEENQNFSVRNKNSNQINLLKAEDQRYQFDLYMRRLEKTLSLLDQILDEKLVKNQKEKEKLINKVIQLGVLQLIYKNSHRDQKQQLQWYFKVNEQQTSKVFRQRVFLQINELKGIKEIHANKNWSEVATKNFFKALDLKGFQFKKNQKQKMKGTFFIAELLERNKILQNGGQSKSNIITFQNKKQFFTILNSFESSSRTEKCMSRNPPNVDIFDLKDEQKRHFYPAMIISFEDQGICQNVYSLTLFYIDSSQMGQPQKCRCKMFLEQFLVKFLGWKKPVKKLLSQYFDQQKLYSLIAKTNQQAIDVSNWIFEEPQQPLLMISEQQEEQAVQIKFLNDKASEYSYLPAKTQNKIVLYGSEHLYTLSRFIYALYQRLIKMRQVTEDQNKIQLFQMLFFACIKAKQGIKFEQNLNILFGKHAYLFSTFYKLFDNLIKNVSNISNCLLTNYSFKFVNQQSEDIYFVRINRFCLSNCLTNSKILRLTYEKIQKILYFNYLESYYKADDISKDIMKKRMDITKGIQIYTIDSFGLGGIKKRKANEIMQNSGLEYIFEGSTIRMLNHQSRQDLLTFIGKKSTFQKMMKRQLKKVHKLVTKIN